MILLLLKTNLLDLCCSSRNIQILLKTTFIFLEKAMEEFMFHMVLGKFTKTIYNSTSPMDVIRITNGQMLALKLYQLTSPDITLTSKE